MKNLKTLERAGLLKSDSYGVKMEGKEKFWRILATKTDSPKKRQLAVLEELGVTQTPWKIHSTLYEHEKACGDVFVSFAITNSLLEWRGEGDQKSGFRHDRMFRFSDRVNYLEMEMGNHGKDILRDKVKHYLALFRKTRRPFNVLFSLPTEQGVEDVVGIFDELGVGKQYGAVLQSELVKDALSARVTHALDTIPLSKYVSKYIPNE